MRLATTRHVLGAFSLSLSLLACGLTPAHGADETLYVATPLTQPKEFTPGIEGPQCDREGNIYVVNFATEGTIGKVTPAGKAQKILQLPSKSVGNGIVFDRAGYMYIADYTGHNVLRANLKTSQISVFAHDKEMNQPNDVAIAPNETLYASDPNWEKGTGQVWKITTDGNISRVATDMGTTNGIDVSPDGKQLYVNESIQRNVWVFDIKTDGTLENKRLIKQFEDFGFDGMRCDVAGNLCISRYGKGTVVIMTPKGEILKEIDVLGKKPTNVCFGGPDGRTVYVTEVDHTRLVQFRVEKPGLAWQRWQGEGK
ncbi:MAG: SMP-30/gluconolactonase/LRE family protein [Planctomycetota bacterium]